MIFDIFLKKFKLFGLEYFKKYYSFYKAEVHSNEDPESLGRLQLKVPEIYGTNAFEYWAKPKGIFAGNGIGFYNLPNVGDNVYVEFEGGNPLYPVWSYRGWSTGEVPEEATPNNRVLQTTSGHRVEFDDENKQIKIKVAEKEYSIELNATGISLVSDNLFLGSLDGSSEAAALGDTLKSKLDDICDEVTSIATNVSILTVASFGTPPVNATSFIQNAANMTTIKGTLLKILSDKVKLD